MKRLLVAGLLVVGFGLSTLSISCDKMLDVESRHIVNEENKWKDINDAKASLLGVYGLLRTAMADNNAHWLYGELRQGDFSVSNRRDLEVIINGELKSSYDLVNKLSNWRKFYAVINAANLFIENSGKIVERDPQYTQLNNNIDKAQMRVIIGFTYYLLARTWGEVPIWDKAYEGKFPQLDKSSFEQVLTYAEQQVKLGKDQLPFNYGQSIDPIYPSATYFGNTSIKWDGVLFNRLSANAILAHIAALGGNYLETSIYTNYVLTNASKAGATFVASSIFTDQTSGFFNGSSASQIIAFPFGFTNGEASYDGHIESLTLAAPLVSKPLPDIYIPLDKIVNIFTESDDSRFSYDSEGKINSTYFSNLGGLYPIFSKIKIIRQGVSGSDGSLPLFASSLVFTRLEEMALLRAEALTVLNGENEEARGLLNQVRMSRGLGRSEASGDLMDQIFAERRRELMGEGWRWFDIVRYNKIKRNNPAFNSLIDEKGIFWPIAQDVLDNNPVIKQNTYWQ